MIIALSDLISQETADQVVQTVADILVAVGIPADKWRKAGSLSSLFRAMSQNFVARDQIRVNSVSANLLDLAAALTDPTWLRAKAQFDYAVNYIPATFATGELTIENTGSGIYGPFAPGAFLVKKPGVVASDDRYYQNASTFSLNPGDVLTEPFTAVAIGSSSTAGPGEIDTLVSSLDGVTVTNDEAFIGSDDEQNADLLERTKESLGMLSPNGPGDAIQFVAKTPDFSATSSPITRVSVFTDPTTGYVYTYVANAAGIPSSGDVDIVRAAIEEWATPNCRTNVVAAPTALVVPITYKVWVKNTAATEQQIKDAVEAQLLAFFSQIDIGGIVIPPSTVGELDVDTLKVQIGEATPGIVKIEVTLPASDLTVANNQLPQLGVVNATVVQV